MAPPREDLERTAERLVAAFTAQARTIATAESCTGGMIAAFLTDVPGASAVLERGFVTYSNAAKTEMIGVPVRMIALHGAVSEGVVRSMAEGAIRASRADVAIAVTGVAGPGGGSVDKPVGLVHFALADNHGSLHRLMRFGDLDRTTIRLASVATAFLMLSEWIEAQETGGATGP